MRVIGSGGAVKGLINGSDVQGIPAIDPAQGDLAAGEQRPEQHAGGFGARQQALRLDPPLELLVQALDGIRGSDRLPLFRRIAQEREQSWSGLFQTISDGRALQPPFPEEGLACSATIKTRSPRQSGLIVAGDARPT